MMICGIIDNFYQEFDAVMSQPNSTVSPVVLGSPFGFVNEHTVDILGNYQNFVQVLYTYINNIMLVVCMYVYVCMHMK